jgi:drug/metabolite transporter (DMT)-like permease
VSISSRRPAWKLLGAFAIVYVVWGSTYLAIRISIESIPPFLMAGVRFTVAGLLLLCASHLKGGRRPNVRQVGNASIVGVLMLSVGNGAVTWSEQRVTSGVAALLVATVSLWLLVFNWIFGNRRVPTVAQWIGVAVGLLGLGILVMPSVGSLGRGVDGIGAGAVVCGAMAWAGGTLYARSAELPGSAWTTNGLEMLTGGVALVAMSLMTGELSQPISVSLRSGAALTYLILFGSIVAFSAYTWLNGVTTAARLGTYAYVNPVVAVALGALALHEPVTLRSLLAMALILVGVALLSIVRGRASASPQSAPPLLEEGAYPRSKTAQS